MRNWLRKLFGLDRSCPPDDEVPPARGFSWTYAEGGKLRWVDGTPVMCAKCGREWGDWQCDHDHYDIERWKKTLLPGKFEEYRALARAEWRRQQAKKCQLSDGCIFAAEATRPPDLSDPHACDACRERYRTAERANGNRLGNL